MRASGTGSISETSASDAFFAAPFDFVCSVGWNCSCATYLRRHGLRDCSSPFDWLIFSTFERRIALLETGFAGFLSKENLRRMPSDTKCPRKGLVPYRDESDGFVLFHDFPEDRPFDEAYAEVRAKYDRRCARLLARLAASRRTLLVWRSPVDRIPDEELRAARTRLSRHFPGNDVNLLVVENDLARAGIGYETPGAGMLRAVGPIVPDINVPDGDVPVNNAVFSRIRRAGPPVRRPGETFRRLLVKVLACPHPTKKGRAAARRRLSTRFGLD